jgi:ubiquinone/menaquinone biosynthesis C-methylase UbiE
VAKPLFIARQSRHAHGLLGRLVAFVMARETQSDNAAAIAALEVEASDRVLDVGCGHGRSVEALAAKAGFVTGVDPSELMADVATERNARAVKAGRVRIFIASAEHVPCESASFDKVLCVHVIYFWRDLDAVFAELARVLKPGGRLALLFRDADDEAAVRAFPAEVYTFPETKAVLAALERVGFATEMRSVGASMSAKSPSPRLVIATRQASRSGSS